MLCFCLPFIMYNVGILGLESESVPPREQQQPGSGMLLGKLSRSKCNTQTARLHGAQLIPALFGKKATIGDWVEAELGFVISWSEVLRCIHNDIIISTREHHNALCV